MYVCMYACIHKCLHVCVKQRLSPGAFPHHHTHVFHEAGSLAELDMASLTSQLTQRSSISTCQVLGSQEDHQSYPAL